MSRYLSLSFSTHSSEAQFLPESGTYIFSTRLEASKPQQPFCLLPPQNSGARHMKGHYVGAEIQILDLMAAQQIL